MTTSFVTEKEATGENALRGKLCPELSNGHARFDCVGSRCMAWRAMTDSRQIPIDAPNMNYTGWEKAGAPREAIVDTSGGRAMVQWWTREVGWCGKFGKPEE